MRPMPYRVTISVRRCPSSCSACRRGRARPFMLTRLCTPLAILHPRQTRGHETAFTALEGAKGLLQRGVGRELSYDPF